MTGKKEKQSSTSSCTAVKERTARPPMWRVVILNDDYTSMDFVVQLLKTVFGKSQPEAERLMMDVHRSGRGIVGVYVREVAETLAAKSEKIARDNGFPLRCIAEKDSE